MVQNTFAQKQVELQIGLRDACTLECLVDPSTGEVVAVTEYVYMRRYVWVECFVVKPSYQSSGIGALLIGRYF